MSMQWVAVRGVSWWCGMSELRVFVCLCVLRWCVDPRGKTMSHSGNDSGKQETQQQDVCETWEMLGPDSLETS